MERDLAAAETALRADELAAETEGQIRATGKLRAEADRLEKEFVATVTSFHKALERRAAIADRIAREFPLAPPLERLSRTDLADQMGERWAGPANVHWTEPAHRRIESRRPLRRMARRASRWAHVRWQPHRRSRSIRHQGVNAVKTQQSISEAIAAACAKIATAREALERAVAQDKKQEEQAKLAAPLLRRSITAAALALQRRVPRPAEDLERAIAEELHEQLRKGAPSEAGLVELLQAAVEAVAKRA